MGPERVPFVKSTVFLRPGTIPARRLFLNAPRERIFLYMDLICQMQLSRKNERKVGLRSSRRNKQTRKKKEKRTVISNTKWKRNAETFTRTTRIFS